MTLPPSIRKMALMAHITCSVGWLSADAGFLALAIVGLTSQDAQLSRAAYPSMGLIDWFVIVPLSLGALLTGLVQSLGTKWGLLWHNWFSVEIPDSHLCRHRLADSHTANQPPSGRSGGDNLV